MKENQKIKVLIVENEIEGYGFAMAGLLPLAKDEKETVTPKQRAILAQEHYEIEWAKTLQEGFTLAKEFNPDLAIIDVDMGDGCITPPIKDGIELFQVLEQDETFKGEKILFSAHFNAPKYYGRLKSQLLANFIPKATHGGGYENLAGKIAIYLKRITTRILQSAPLLTKKELEEDLPKWSVSALREREYDFGNRKLDFSSLALFCSTPINKGKKGSKKIELDFPNAAEELHKIIQAFAIVGEGEETALWKREHIQKALKHYSNKLGRESEPEMNIRVTRILKKMFINSFNESSLKELKTLGLFSMESYHNTDIETNENFRNRLLNCLAIRKILIFFERFASRYFDEEAQKSSMNDKTKLFLKEYTQKILCAVKVKSEIEEALWGQCVRRLNLSLKKSYGKSRASINLNKYRLMEWEIKWVSSQEFEELLESCYNISRTYQSL